MSRIRNFPVGIPRIGYPERLSGVRRVMGNGAAASLSHGTKTPARIRRCVLSRAQSRQLPAPPLRSGGRQAVAVTEQRARFELLGADREAVRAARLEWWEERLRRCAAAFRIDLADLPRKKSAVEKLTLAAAMKQTTSVSMAWLAQPLQTGATDSVGSLLTRFRAAGCTETAEFRSRIPDS
jgi:hypothetical protein